MPRLPAWWSPPRGPTPSSTSPPRRRCSRSVVDPCFDASVNVVGTDRAARGRAGGPASGASSTPRRAARPTATPTCCRLRRIIRCARLALRRVEDGRRALPRMLGRPDRRPRVDAAAGERLRPAPGPRGRGRRHRHLHVAPADGRAAASSTATASRRATTSTSATSPTRSSRAVAVGRRRRGREHRHRHRDDGERAVPAARAGHRRCTRRRRSTARPGPASSGEACSTRAAPRRCSGWTAATSLDEGLAQTVAWFRKELTTHDRRRTEGDPRLPRVQGRPPLRGDPHHLPGLPQGLPDPRRHSGDAHQRGRALVARRSGRPAPSGGHPGRRPGHAAAPADAGAGEAGRPAAEPARSSPTSWRCCARTASTDVILACSYRVDDVRAALGDGERLGVRLRYVVEDEPLGTGGGVRNAADLARGRSSCSTATSSPTPI